MFKVSDFSRSLSFARRTAGLAAAACMVVAGAHAQQSEGRGAGSPAPASSAANQNVASFSGGPLSFLSPEDSAPTLDLAHAAGVSYSSSASPALDAVDASAAANLDLPALPEDAAQPPPRRRYGRPRYNDSSHNPDGSSKYAFIAGVGLTLATGNTYHYLNTSYSYQVGAGRNFNKNFSVIAQFDWDNFGFNGRTLGNQLYVENQYITTFCNISTNQGSPLCQGGLLPSLDGNSHVWSFSINPVYNIYSRAGLGAYVVAGVGYYHKVANFTTPETGYGEDAFGDIYEYSANATIDHYTSNAPGFSAGVGLTFKPSRFANQRLYVEGRYVFIDNSQRTGVTVNNISTLTVNSTNLYPANSNRTTYIPIKVGIRF